MLNKKELQQNTSCNEFSGHDAQSIVFKAVKVAFANRPPLGDLNVTSDGLNSDKVIDGCFSALGQTLVSELASSASDPIGRSDRDGFRIWPVSRGNTVREQE